MRKLIVGLVLLGATALSGCAHQSSWNYDTSGWAVQSWDTEPVMVTERSCMLAGNHPGIVVVDTRFRSEACCDVKVSNNSWGPRAGICGGRRSETIARQDRDGNIHYIEASYKPAPIPMPLPAPSAPSPRSAPMTAGMTRTAR